MFYERAFVDKLARHEKILNGFVDVASETDLREVKRLLEGMKGMTQLWLQLESHYRSPWSNEKLPDIDRQRAIEAVKVLATQLQKVAAALGTTEPTLKVYMQPSRMS